MAAVLTSEIKEGLELIRVRQRRMAHVLMGLIPFVLVGAILPPDFQLYYIAAAAAYGTLMLVYGLRLAFTECPRCHGFFHWNWWSDPWTTKCLHCKLPRDAEPGDDHP